MGFESQQMLVTLMYHSCFSTFTGIRKVDWSSKAQEIDDEAILSIFLRSRFSSNQNEILHYLHLCLI